MSGRRAAYWLQLGDYAFVSRYCKQLRSSGNNLGRWQARTHVQVGCRRSVNTNRAGAHYRCEWRTCHGQEIISHPNFASTDTSSLLTLGGGGAQLQPDLVGKIDQQVATARPNTGYGMTETCGIITSISGDHFVDKPASCGPAMPAFESKIVNPESHEEVPTGEPGELWVRGAHVIRGI